jgi:hypothetical protein
MAERLCEEQRVQVRFLPLTSSAVRIEEEGEADNAAVQTGGLRDRPP